MQDVLLIQTLTLTLTPNPNPNLTLSLKVREGVINGRISAGKVRVRVRVRVRVWIRFERTSRKSEEG